MKNIDFTKPGGFPLTQDQLNYLQVAYTESITALAQMGSTGGAAFIVSGMEITVPAPGAYHITDGWLMYHDELVRFYESGVTGTGSGLDPFIVLSTAASPLTYNDGSTPNVILEKSAELQALAAATPTDATHFPLSILQRFGAGFGKANREMAWNAINVATPAAAGGVTGTIYYKKDFTANTLHLRGALTANNAQNFAASPGAGFYVAANLPLSYSPSFSVYFQGHYYIAALAKDDMGVGWIKQVNCGVNSLGQIFINWIRPDVSISGYGINFNCVVPLD